MKPVIVASLLGISGAVIIFPPAGSVASRGSR